MTRRAPLGLALGLLVAACGGPAPTAPATTAAPSSAPASTSAATVGPSPSSVAPVTPPPSIDPAATPAADLVQVPGTHVFMAPLTPFIPSDSFPGFQDAASGSSVLVVELPESSETMIAEMTDTALAFQGIAVERRETITLADGRPAELVAGGQRQGDIEYTKLLLLTGDETATALITATVPTAAPDAGTLEPTVTAMLSSTFFDADLEVDPEAVLPFTIEPADPLAFDGAFGQAATYKPAGSDDPLDPILVVAVSAGAPTDDLGTFAATLLQQAALVTIDTIESSEPFSAGELEGVELVATATHEQGEPLVIHHVVFPLEGGYAVLQGRCRIADRDACLATFRATDATFRSKD